MCPYGRKPRNGTGSNYIISDFAKPTNNNNCNDFIQAAAAGPVLEEFRGSKGTVCIATGSVLSVAFMSSL